MNTNGCPVCSGLGRILAFGLCDEPVCLPCPECAGLAVTPASADDPPGPENMGPSRKDRDGQWSPEDLDGDAETAA